MSYAKASDYKVVKMNIYLNDKRSGIFRKRICYITFRSDSIKYISMETGNKLSYKESMVLKDKLDIIISYLETTE